MASTIPGRTSRRRRLRAQEVFGPAHLRRLFNRARSAAGARYTADLNVELPIARVFEGLGREIAFERRFVRARDELAVACARIRPPRRGEIEAPDRRRLEALRRRVRTVTAAANEFMFASSSALPFAGLHRRTRAALILARELVEAIEPVRRLPAVEGEVFQTPGRRSEVVAADIGRVARALSELLSICDSDDAACAETAALLVLGYPGRGKTHLFCDVAERRQEQGLVTVPLMGQHFESSIPVWVQIARLVNVPVWTRRQILDALEARARRSGRPALLLIDAINEGGGLELWPIRLTRFLAEVRARRWISIAISCRTSYAPLVVRSISPRHLARIEHVGFALREDEAIARFFEYYHLPLPNVPLLRPEYAVPLFLKLFCAALAEGRVRLPVLGQEGINHLYEAFCRGVGDKIARDLHDPALRGLPWQCAKAIAKALAEQRIETLARPVALQLIAATCGARADPEAMYRAMLNEGLLAEDINSTSGVSSPVVRFPYQQFSHHLVARYLLTQHFKKGGAVASFAPGTPLGSLAADDRTARRNAGLIEALAVQLPERAPIELADLLGQRGGDVVYEAAVESITWRKVTAFPKLSRVIAHLNEAMRRGDADRVTSALLSVAPVPSHPLGIEFLHRNLLRLTLPTRDARWSLYLSRQWDASSIVDRVIRWGEGHDHAGMSDADVKPLAVLTTWFLTSSNRFLRDRATKVLVRLMRRRLELVRDLLTLFETVNDPYVLERLYTAAYGCVLLSEEAEGIASLGRFVYKRFFRAAGPRSTHMLMRDAARGIIERALQVDPTLVGLDPKRFRPPYQSPWPLRSPSAKLLEARSKGDFSGIYWSINRMGDFGKYVLEQAVYDFAARSLKRPYSARRPKPESATSLSSLFAQLADTGQDEGKLKNGADPIELLGRLMAQQPQTAPGKPDKFDAEILRRWVLHRVSSLGWHPRLFADFDKRVNSGDMRESRKEERIGKKYQWIALHEGIGRIADHIWMRDGWGDDARYHECDGAWDVGLRDIDPTLLVKSPPNTDIARVWWQPYPAQLRPSTADQQQRWVESGDIPDIRRLLRPRDNAGADWYVLEAHYHWSEPEPPGVGIDRPSARVLWLQLLGYLVPTADLGAVRTHVERRMDESQPDMSLELRDVFLAEIDWHPSYKVLTAMWERDGVLDPVLERPGERYMWDDGFDCSITATISAYMPGGALRHALQLPPAERPFTFGFPQARVLDPSWGEDGPSTLVIRQDAVSELLADGTRTLLWIVRGEKHMAYGSNEPTDWREIRGIFHLEGAEIRGRVRQSLQRAGESLRDGETRR